MNDHIVQFKNYLIGLKSLSGATAKNYSSRLVLLERRFNKPVQDVTEDELQTYFLEIRPYKKLNTIRLEQTAIKSFFRWYSKKFGKEDPSQELRVGHEEYTAPDIFSPEEFQKMMFACGDSNWVSIRNRAILALLADTGIRIGELVQLKVGNIVFDENNNRFQINILGNTKSYRQRSFPFCEVKDRLIIAENWTMYWQMIKLVKQWHLDAPLFQPKEFGDSGTGIALSISTVQKLVKDVVEKAGIEKNIHVHTFRHTYATYCVVNNINLEVLRCRLGHAKLESTMKYVHLADIVRKDSLIHNPYRYTRTSISGFARAMKGTK